MKLVAPIFSSMTDYECFTTFDQDFAIADEFGLNEVRDTYNRCKEHWLSDYKYWTELTLILNWRLWFWYESGQKSLARLYDELWRDACEQVHETFTPDQLSYYYRITD